MLVGPFCGLGPAICRAGTLACDPNWSLERQNWTLAHLYRYQPRHRLTPLMVDCLLLYYIYILLLLYIYIYSCILLLLYIYMYILNTRV